MNILVLFMVVGRKMQWLDHQQSPSNAAWSVLAQFEEAQGLLSQQPATSSSYYDFHCASTARVWHPCIRGDTIVPGS